MHRRLDRYHFTDAEMDVILFHDRMLAKGDAFYGVAIEPPQNLAGEVISRLQKILRKHGHNSGYRKVGPVIAFQGEYAPHVVEAITEYLESIQHETPSPPQVVRGDYFKMAAFKWLDEIVEQYFTPALK